MNQAAIIIGKQLLWDLGLSLAMAKSNETDREKAAMIAANISSTASAINAIGQTLKTAQDEGWRDDDPRWDSVFKEADEALGAALNRLR